MGKIIKIFFCLQILLATTLYAEKVQQLGVPVDVRSKGETVIAAYSEKLKVRVKIVTHEVNIGKPSDKRPKLINSPCTYSRYPCSIVDRIDISVNGKSIPLPCSVHCAIGADLNTAEVVFEQDKAILTLEGGDAAESYIVKIEFDAEMVTRLVVLDGEAPDQPAVETIYHHVIIK